MSPDSQPPVGDEVGEDGEVLAFGALRDRADDADDVGVPALGVEVGQAQFGGPPMLPYQVRWPPGAMRRTACAVRGPPMPSRISRPPGPYGRSAAVGGRLYDEAGYVLSGPPAVGSAGDEVELVVVDGVRPHLDDGLDGCRGGRSGRSSASRRPARPAGSVMNPRMPFPYPFLGLNSLCESS